ncbi:hypothetical protein [Leisingera daeponensis]|uniref:hypothetical protein n=1 Tax=Leisingera daeponensis TaxID=405746 RepID=UPI001C97207F|nr:hypothetical protein [Leisingera daeponensis]MBY6056662.1 hypothetical protein [Leisingera daeponensis]
MSAHCELNGALDALQDKLKSLNDLVRANQFMVEAMARQGRELRGMSSSRTKDMLRSQARARFHPETGTAPDAAVLAILEEVLGHQQECAEIIPFPVRA